MLENLKIPKYFDPRSPVVTLVIQGIQLQNVLVELRASINVMTKLHIIGLRETLIVFQLADSLAIVLDGILEDVTVTLHSWDYPVDFVVLSPKSSTRGYPIILG